MTCTYTGCTGQNCIMSLKTAEKHVRRHTSKHISLTYSGVVTDWLFTQGTEIFLGGCCPLAASQDKMALTSRYKNVPALSFTPSGYTQNKERREERITFMSAKMLLVGAFQVHVIAPPPRPPPLPIYLCELCALPLLYTIIRICCATGLTFSC